MNTPQDYAVLDEVIASMGTDFVREIVQPSLPVLTHRVLASPAVGYVAPVRLLQWGKMLFTSLGLHDIRWHGRSLRGDSPTGQRVRMTICRCRGRSFCLLMIAGLPGSRAQAQQLARQVAEGIERRARSWQVRRARPAGSGRAMPPLTAV